MNIMNDPKKENPDLIRRGFVSEKREINKEERSIVAYGSTKSMDSYQEVLLPDGWIFERFAKNPVMPWSHNYRLPPVGRALWWKTDSTGLLFKGKFAQTAMADEVWQLYRDGFLNAFSVGYEQLEYVTPNDQEKYQQLLEEHEIPGRPSLIGTRQHLWEISPVVLPANADALVTGIQERKIRSKAFLDTLQQLCENPEFYKQVGHTREILIRLIEEQKEPEKIQAQGTDFEPEPEEKGATSFADLPLAPEDTSWDASKARQNVAKWASPDGSGDKDKINWAKYRKAFFWYDSEDVENFRAYKLPFADVLDGRLKAVWKGVAASMAVLLGARGGVDIPDADRKPVYKHIVKYYKKFDKEPPEFKSWVENEIDEVKEIIIAFSERLSAIAEQLKGYVKSEILSTEQDSYSEISLEMAREYLETRLPELIGREIRRLQGKIE